MNNNNTDFNLSEFERYKNFKYYYTYNNLNTILELLVIYANKKLK